MTATVDRSKIQSHTRSIHLPISPSWKLPPPVLLPMLERWVWRHSQCWWGLVILTHVYLSYECFTVANNQLKLRHRRSCSRPSRSWRWICHWKRGARGSPAPSTHSNMHCDVLNRSKVGMTFVGIFFMHMFMRLYTLFVIVLENKSFLICVHLYFAANEEYYQMLMINDSQPPGFDVSSYTIEEINSITSEYTLKNTVSTSSLHLTGTESSLITRQTI